MNVNKKLDRFKQWAGERMGGETKTSVSDEFKELEVEMGLRHEGMKENHKAMSAYVKNMSKRNEIEDKEKVMPVALLGQTMSKHGEEFENNSEFGQCLMGMGQANERIARTQETYVGKATSSWLESLERSIAQMKEYQAARKKLDGRRLAYDTALAKMEKAKKEDYRVEEELRSQKAKYEESSEDVLRRMQDIKEAEADSVSDLGEFLDAEVAYYDRCREILMQLKKDWPARSSDLGRSQQRSRTNTAHVYNERYNAIEEDAPAPAQPERPAIRSNRTASSSVPQSPAKERGGFDFASGRPGIGRSTTLQGPAQMNRDLSPVAAQRMSRVPSDSLTIRTQKSQLRSLARPPSNNDMLDEPSDTSTHNSNETSSPERHYDNGSSATGSYGYAATRSVSAGTLGGKKAPPPPPPFRAKKPPPPPPSRRSALGSDTDCA